MTTTVAELRSTLMATAAERGAAAYLLDEIVKRALDSVQSLKTTQQCGSLTFVDPAVKGAMQELVGSKELGALTPAVRASVQSVTCGAGSTASVQAAVLSQKLEQHRSAEVEGFPVKLGKGRNVVFKVAGAEVSVAVPIVTLTTSAFLRRHANGSVTYVRAGSSVRADARVVKVTPVANKKGRVIATFANKKGDVAFGQVETQDDARVGRTATVFLNNRKVVEVIAWDPIVPSKTPSLTPSKTPSLTPSKTPSLTPSKTPSLIPSKTPSLIPSKTPSLTPSKTPSRTPSRTPRLTASPTPTQGDWDERWGGDGSDPQEKRIAELEELIRSMQTPVASVTPTAMMMDPVTGQPLVTEAPGITLDLTVKTGNENENEALAGNEAWPVGGGLLVEEVTATVPPETTAPTPEPSEPAPPAPPLVCPPAPTCSGTTLPAKDGKSFFCMTKRTFYIVVCMMVLACVLVGVGYWIYRKKALGGANNAGGGSPGGGGLDDLGLGGGPGGGFDLGPPR